MSARNDMQEFFECGVFCVSCVVVLQPPLTPGAAKIDRVRKQAGLFFFPDNNQKRSVRGNRKQRRGDFTLNLNTDMDRGGTNES